MAKISVTVKNPQEFQKFLVKYVEDGNTNKLARWVGVPRKDKFVFVKLTNVTNFARPQMIGEYFENEDGTLQLFLSIRIHRRVRILAAIIVGFIGFISLLKLDPFIMLGGFILSMMQFMMGYVLYLIERADAKHDMKLLGKMAQCDTVEQMEGFLKDLSPELF